MMRKLIASAMLAVAIPAAANAATLSYDFMFMGSDFGSGTLMLADTLNASGGYDIVDISGTFGGNMITGLVPTNSPTPPSTIQIGQFTYTFDNIAYPTAPIKLDEYGLAFYAGGSFYNIFDATGSGGTSITPYGLYVDEADLTLGNFVLTRSSSGVPEASSWAMLIIGFGMIGGSTRYARRTRPLRA